MKIAQKQRFCNFSNKGQYWDIFLFFFVVFAILSGVVYYFTYKFGGVPNIETNREFAPAERGVLPEGTIFPK